MKQVLHVAVTIRKEQITITVVSVSFTNSNACNPHVDITNLHLTPSLCLYSLDQTSCLFNFFRLVWCRLQVYQAVSKWRSQCGRWSRRTRMSRGRDLLCGYPLWFKCGPCSCSSYTTSSNVIALPVLRQYTCGCTRSVLAAVSTRTIRLLPGIKLLWHITGWWNLLIIWLFGDKVSRSKYWSFSRFAQTLTILFAPVISTVVKVGAMQRLAVERPVQMEEWKS